MYVWNIIHMEEKVRLISDLAFSYEHGDGGLNGSMCLDMWKVCTPCGLLAISM
jgi:hypothetical protein